jgi:4-alpha-glucanotransferase
MWAGCWANIDAGNDVEHNRRELRAMMDFAGLKDEEPPRVFSDRLHEAFTRAMMESNAWLAVFQVQDVFAQTARFNVPGSTSTTNWSARLPQTVKQLDNDPAFLARTKMFSRLAMETGRVV